RPFYPQQIQQLHAAFLKRLLRVLVAKVAKHWWAKRNQGGIFSHHLRRYFTSSRSCSAYWSVRSLCVCPIHIFSRSHGTQFLRSQDARKRRKMWKSHFVIDHQNPYFSERSPELEGEDRKSTRLNSSHLVISYAVFCL